ncbi:hypothetical protein GDO81_013253 [Engystomops pustulosus]|nr:hypothetical protein GDO81_013253 [Engystomops pustulosus]KAG8566442.1 hypothetical protein GDO81_013253 [Engystomops pustulosus]KAG8566443.1 hypothetical protein GDO81_013253 [Engystomops pustulosus]KAG8566444.1 hypothetical protein GDO81_013253 [Engystomops pustulosus]
MPDTTSLRFNGIFPGAKLTMNIWKYDRIDELVKFAAAGELEKLKTMGVTQDSAFITANSARLTVKQRKEWLAARAGLGLYVATHRGHLNVLRFLIQNGCNVQYKTCCGNTPLHVAAAMGNVDCMSELLANGAQPQDTNQNGHTALDLARLCGQKTTERRLYLFNWEKRSANAPPIKTHLDSSELFAHQKFDSKLKTWRNGTYAKRYMANLISYPEFHGSHFSAPPKKIPDKK